jgi:hypothetical protein
MEVKGRVTAQVYGANGKVDGVLLEDGPLIRLAQGFAPSNTDCLKPGRDVVATGIGLVSLLRGRGERVESETRTETVSTPIGAGKVSPSSIIIAQSTAGGGL